LQPGLVIWLCLAVAALWLHCIDRPLRRFGREPIFPRRPLPEPALSEPGVLAEAAA